MCKPGAYQDDRLTHLCQPCSRCCDDQDDLVEPQCQEMPENKRCSFHRSHVCSKVITRTNFSSVSSVETNHTVSLVLVPSPTSQVTASLSMRTAYQKTPVADRHSRAAIIGAAVGVPLAVVLLLLVICYFLICELSFFLSPISEHQLFKKAPKDNSCHTVVKTTTINTVTYCSTCSSGPESTGYGEE